VKGWQRRRRNRDLREQLLLKRAVAASRRRIAYGARCGWWDSIDKVGTKASGLPCCPHCGGVLFEVATEEEWWASARRHEADGHPGYVAALEWSRGQCFPSVEALLTAAAEALA
jgi:hypothetical protein